MADLMKDAEKMINEMRTTRAQSIAEFVGLVPTLVRDAVTEAALQRNTGVANGLSVPIPFELESDGKEIVGILNDTWPNWKFSASWHSSGSVLDNVLVGP